MKKFFSLLTFLLLLSTFAFSAIAEEADVSASGATLCNDDRSASNEKGALPEGEEDEEKAKTKSASEQ